MLYYIILYYTILYYTILYYTILYYTILYYTILYYNILYYTILYFTVLYCTLLYCTILYYTILYYTILYYTVLYCTVLCCTILYYTVLYCTILYSTLLYSSLLYYFSVEQAEIPTDKTYRHKEALCRGHTSKNMPTYRLQMRARHHTSLHISRCNQALCGNIHERSMAFISVLVTSQRSTLPRDYREKQWLLGQRPGNLSFIA